MTAEPNFATYGAASSIPRLSKQQILASYFFTILRVYILFVTLASPPLNNKIITSLLNCVCQSIYSTSAYVRTRSNENLV